MNMFKSFVLMLVLTALFMLIGSVAGGRQGATWALIMAGAMNFFGYWFSDKIVLMMHGAKAAQESDAPELYRIVRELTQKARIPMPRVYLMDSPIPNAFATGRNPQHAAVAATTGILGLLDARELRGVLGHELSHIFHRDILLSSIAATLAGAIMWLADMARWGAMFGGWGGREDRERGNGLGLLFVAIIAPIAAMLIQLAISRSREYHADEGGAGLTGDPLALASALRKISAGIQRSPVPLTTNPATAHLFIANPLRGRDFATLFSTHPPTEERVRRLEAMAAHTSQASYNVPKIVY